MSDRLTFSQWYCWDILSNFFQGNSQLSVHFLDAIAFLSTYTFFWVSKSVSEWVMFLAPSSTELVLNQLKRQLIIPWPFLIGSLLKKAYLYWLKILRQTLVKVCWFFIIVWHLASQAWPHPQIPVCNITLDLISISFRDCPPLTTQTKSNEKLESRKSKKIDVKWLTKMCNKKSNIWPNLQHLIDTMCSTNASSD